MAYYRLYFVRDDHFVGFDEIFADEDGAAVEAAREKSGALGMELWCGRRKVEHFPAAEALA